MKRMVSFLLAAVLILAPTLQVFASEPDISVVTEDNQPEAASEETNQNPGTTDEQDAQDELPETKPDTQAEENPATGEENQPESDAARTDHNVETENIQEANTNAQENDSEEQRSLTDIGQVHVSVGSAVILEKELTLTVELTGQNSKTITLPSDKDAPGAKKMVSFEKLQERNVHTKSDGSRVCRLYAGH